MVSAFEVTSFPDLTLPRYYDLFGEEALAVAATRLFTWLQLDTTARKGRSFTLRYLFDPSRTPSNRRLRIFVILRSAAEEPNLAEIMGRRLTNEVLRLKDATVEEVLPPEPQLDYLAALERNATLVFSGTDASYLPALWTRQSAARNASEPYLDEAFAALVDPAFLDIQLHTCDAGPARKTVRAVIELLERRKQAGSGGDADTLHHVSALGAAISEDPVCRLLICAGSSERNAAEGLLRAFGVDAIGGARFKIVGSVTGSGVYSSLRSAVENGAYEFANESGWFSQSLADEVSRRKDALSDPQIHNLRRMSELSVLAGAELIRDVLTLPIPRRGFLRTFPLETETQRRHPPVVPQSRKDVVVLGTSLERHTEIALPLEDLTRHAFVAGVTGSGKTVTMFNVLQQLAEQDVPFLVLEPAKAEYRALARLEQLNEPLRIYTPGRDDLSPLRINPFAFDSHISLASHIAGLSAAFNCGLSLFEPLATIFEGTLWDLYEAKGWREYSQGSSKFALPRVDEIPEAVCRSIDLMGYDAEIRDRFKGAIRSRFIKMSRGSVGRLFDCQQSSPSLGDLCNAMSVVELRALSQQEANLVTMFLLMAIREHLSDSLAPDGRPRLVVVLEEAHNLVPAVSDEHAGGEEASAKVEASRYISNMLAEMRALGLGMFVVDQTPAAVAPQVVRNTNLKIAHRTVARQDRETLADAMLMHPAHSELLGRLVPGEAYVYADRYYRPQLMQGALVKGTVAISDAEAASGWRASQPPADDDLVEWLEKRRWYRTELEERIIEMGKRLAFLLDELEAVGKMLNEVDLLVGITDPGALAARCARLSALSRERMKVLAVSIRSLDAEFHAAELIAKKMAVEIIAKTDVEALHKITELINERIVEIERVQG